MPFFRKSATKFLVPARHSRHRTACLALYRALLRLAPQVPLPHDLATGWGEGVNPVALHIERAFRRNLGDTSPRIIYPALSAGYNMLAVLKGAATSLSEPSPSEPSNEPNAHHAQITSFLRERLAERRRSHAAWIPPPPKPGPRPNAQPLLVKVTPEPTRFDPDPAPKYIASSRPRLQSELGGSGKRKIPVMELAASEFPFLRFSKPIPPDLSRVIKQRFNRRLERAAAVMKWVEEMHDMELEDEWEATVAQLLWDQHRQGKEGGVEKDKKGRRLDGKRGDEGDLRTVRWVFADTTSPNKNKYGRPVYQFQAEERRHALNTAWAIDEDVLRREIDWQDEYDIGPGTGRDERSFAHSLWKHGIQHTETWLSAERSDLRARAEALRLLVREERDLQSSEREAYKAERRKIWEAKMQRERGDGWRLEIDLENYWRAAEARYRRLRTNTDLTAREIDELRDWESRAVQRHGVEWTEVVRFEEIPPVLGDMLAHKYPVPKLPPPTREGPAGGRTSTSQGRPERWTVEL